MTDSLSDGGNQPIVDANIDYLKAIAGEGAKFDRSKYDSEDAWKTAVARGKYEADQHIKQIEAERAQERAEYQRLRDDYNTRAKLEEIRDQIAQMQLASSDKTLNANEDQKPTLDPKMIEDIFESKYQQAKAQEIANANFNKVRDKLIEVKGDSYPAFIKQQRENLGLSAEDVDALARKSPNAFYNTFGLNTSNTETFQAPPHSSRSFAPQGAPKRTWAYYENLRKTDRRLYETPKIQDQMIKDAIDLGDAFQDGNYKQLP